MSRKNDILTNLREYSSDQIAEAINDGVVTLYELSKSGSLTPLMRKRIEEKLAAGSSTTASEETKQPQKVMQLTDVETPSKEVEVPSNQEETESKMEKVTIPEVVIPEAVIAPMEQTLESETRTTEQEQPIYDEGPSNKGMFKRPFSFHGRIRRLEYGLSVLFFYLYAIVAGFVLGLITNGDFSEATVYVCLIPGYWFLWAQGAKRCHDRNNTSWYQIIPFYALWMLFADGDEGENDYGDNPKGK